jgi:hypothetical protein
LDTDSGRQQLITAVESVFQLDRKERELTRSFDLAYERNEICEEVDGTQGDIEP